MSLIRISIIVIYIILLSITLNSKVIQNKLLDRVEIHEGVTYEYYQMGKHSKKLRVHVLKINRSNNSIETAAHTAGEFANELSSLIEYDTLNSNSIATVNASFYQAGTNLPVGFTVIDKKVVQLKNYKKWSSLVISADSLYISELSPEAYMLLNDEKVEIDRFNHRRDSTEIVCYNSFYSNRIPKIDEEYLDSLYMLYLKENHLKTLAGDSYEPPISFTNFKEMYRNTYYTDDKGDFYRYLLTPLSKNLINTEQEYRVKEVTNGNLKIEGDDLIVESLNEIQGLNTNETVEVQINTGNDDSEIVHIITSTPQLLKNGREYMRANEEGSSSHRFIKEHLPRSAFGFNSEIIYLVAVEPNRGRKVKGATLLELAWVMETIGAKEAINLDGGGSTSFIIDGKNYAIPYDNSYSRKVSTGISVFIESE